MAEDSGEMGDSDPEPYALSEEDVVRLSRLLAAFEGGRLDTVTTARAPALGGPQWTQLGKVTKVITSTFVSAGKPHAGKGTVALWRKDAGDVISDSLIRETAWNVLPSAIAVGSWVLLARDPWSGGYWAHELCACPTPAPIPNPVECCQDNQPGIICVTFDHPALIAALGNGGQVAATRRGGPVPAIWESVPFLLALCDKTPSLLVKVFVYCYGSFNYYSPLFVSLVKLSVPGDESGFFEGLAYSDIAHSPYGNPDPTLTCNPFTLTATGIVDTFTFTHIDPSCGTLVPGTFFPITAVAGFCGSGSGSGSGSSSPPGSIITPCCPDTPLPATLHLTITSAACPDLDGTYAVPFFSASGGFLWSADTFVACGGSLTCGIECVNTGPGGSYQWHVFVSVVLPGLARQTWDGFSTGCTLPLDFGALAQSDVGSVCCPQDSIINVVVSE